jgi:hypothetical protein
MFWLGLWVTTVSQAHATTKPVNNHTPSSNIDYADEDFNHGTLPSPYQSYEIYYILVPICVAIVALVIAIIFALKKILSIAKANSFKSFSKHDLPSIVIAKNSIASELSDSTGSTLNSNL